MLLFLTWSLGLVASLWWQALVNTWVAYGTLLGGGTAGWSFTFTTFAPWEPWVDFVLVHGGILFLIWRWIKFLKVLWNHYWG